MNNWEKHLGIKYPTCKMTGQCCRMASPSTPAVKLLLKAAEGNSYARDFLSIFIPYTSIEEAKKISPGLVDRALVQAAKSPKFDSVDQVVFFYCRYINDDNKCMIYEDRPQLCRDYPDTPFLVMSPDCAFEAWSKECKEKYKQINTDLKALKEIQKALANIDLNAPKSTKSIVYSTYIISPAASWLI